MEKELRPGIILRTIATKQFTTTNVIFSFTKKVESAKELTLRTLLAYVLETSCQKWPTQEEVARELSRLYGAGFGTTINRRGKVHSLNFVLSVINNRFLSSKEDLLDASLDFLKEMIFSPLVGDKGFDQATFALQKKNLLSYMNSLVEDPRLLALYGLRAKYFTDSMQATPQYGNKESLTEISPQELYDYYQQMIANDFVQIVVCGDIDEQQIEQKISSFPLKKRQGSLGSIAYDQLVLPGVKRFSRSMKLRQTKLDLAYHLPLNTKGQDFFTAVMLNGIFGGDPQSKLFLNVREKASLAYYASSSFDSLRNILWVQTGIKASNQERVEKLVLKQLEDIRQGEISAEKMENIRQSLINDYVSRLDSQSMLGIRAQIDYLLDEHIDSSAWISRINKVKMEDIVDLANKMKLQTIYCLQGEAQK